MTEEETGRIRRSHQADDGSYSGTAFSAWEDALEKLKALDYEANFCRPSNIRPFSRSFFSVPGANGSLQVDKYDDPNTAVNRLMLALTSMGFELKFPANKLKQAHGEAVCSVLNFLTEKALSASGHIWRRPVHAEEETTEEAEPVDDCDMADIADETEVQEEEETDFAGINKIPSSTAGKEWRGHVEQTKKYEEAIQEALPATSTQLALVSNEMTESVERMSTKERFINSHHEHLREEYRQMSEASPLVSIKQALQEIKAEIKTFDLRIGVVSHTLLSTKMQRGKVKAKAKGNSPKNGDYKDGRAPAPGLDDDDFDISDSGDSQLS